MAGRRGQTQHESSFAVISIDRLDDLIAGLSEAGGCRLLLRKTVDAADKVDGIHFGPGKPAGKAQGKADTLLEEHVFECDHGPEDYREGSLQHAAAVKMQRQSKKSQGLSYKVGCKMQFSAKRYMHPQLRSMYKIIMSEASHSNHSKDAPVPGHVRRGRLSSDAHAHIACLVVQGVPPEIVLSRWLEYLRGQHAACREFPAQTLEQYCEDHPDSTFARDMGMTRDDVRNVTRRTLPNLWELHPDAATNVRLRETAGNTSKIFCFQPQDRAAGKGFLLGLTSPFMLSQAALHGHGRAVLVDATHAMNRYNFLLTTLAVMDAFGHAVVVGWLFHEDKTAEALAHGFSAWLRAVAGVKSDFRAASFFSDDDPAEHKAIRLAFGEDMPVYLCIWHLLKAIKQKLGQLVKVADVRCAMDLYIRGIVYHVGEVGWGRDHLNTLVAKALAGFEAKFGGQHAAHDDFIKYIMDHYAKRPEMWVLAYRDGDHSQQTTTGAVEGLHSYYKREMAKRAPMLRGRELALGIAMFYEVFEAHFRVRAWQQQQGYHINTYRRAVVDSALEAARGMPPGAVEVLDAAAGSCMVQASSRAAGEYMVQSALGVNPACTCPVGRGGMFCKHVAAGMLAFGVPELVVRQVRGILHGTDRGYARATQLAGQYAAASSAPTVSSGCGVGAASEAAWAAAQVPPACTATCSASGPAGTLAGGGRDAAPRPACSRTSVDQRARFRAVMERLLRAVAGCPEQSFRLEELTQQLTVLATHQEGLNLRDGSGEQRQAQPLMPVTNAFNSSSVTRVPGALDGYCKRKAASNAGQRRTAACPADAALLPAGNGRKRKMTWQQQLAADGGDVAAVKLLSQLPEDVTGSWARELHIGGELLSLVLN